MIDDDETRTRILVVDDHDLMAETLRRALTVEPDFGVVGRVASVASAVEAAALFHPDVIVMDFLLPDGTGAEATALIKADCPSIEVVMVTGQSNPATLAQALEAGCSGFVAKEGRFDDLIDTIRAVVRGEVRVPRSLVEELATHLRPRAPSLGSDLTTRTRNTRVVGKWPFDRTDGRRTGRKRAHRTQPREEHSHEAAIELSSRSRRGCDAPRLAPAFVRRNPPHPALNCYNMSIGPLDATDHALLEQAAIIRSANDAILSTTLDGRITSWNPGAERMLRYAAGTIIGRSIELLVPPELLEKEREAFAHAARGDRIPAYETVRLRADGVPIDVSISVSPIVDSAAVVTGVSTIASDISQRRREVTRQRALERRIDESQRLDSLGNLAGRIAHDFNNLLGVILNYTEFVAEEIKENEMAIADIDQIRTATARATGLTRQLLTFGRREATQPQNLDVARVVREAATSLTRTIGEHVELVVRAEPGLPAVWADGGQLEQVLVDLAANARDAMPDGGTLTVETALVEFDEATAERPSSLAAGTYVSLSVSDTGTGMGPEVLAHAFEPFFSTKPRDEGSGLGLATVHGIIAGANGGVVLDSEQGIGTTARVYLPARLAV